MTIGKFTSLLEREELLFIYLSERIFLGIRHEVLKEGTPGESSL